MTMEDEEKSAKPEGEAKEAQAESTAASEPSAELETPKAEEKAGGRMNAAKAFYRAMYAGEDAAPEDFGINLAPAGAASPAADTARVRELEMQVSELEAKNTETDTHLKRLAADFENYRRRTDKEREEFAANGALRAIEAILPAIDDLDRAQMTLNASMDPKSILESFRLVGNSFTRCLEQIGAKPLVVIGEPFDPRLHEPVQEIHTNEYPDSTVIHELRRGFMFKERVLRPALVNVTAALSEEEAAAQEQAKAAQASTAQAAAPEVAAPAAPEAVAETAPEAAAAVVAAPEAAAEVVAPAPAPAPAAEQTYTEISDAPADASNLTVDISPINAQELDANGSEAGDTVQVYEISDDESTVKTEELAEAQAGTQVSDD